MSNKIELIMPKMGESIAEATILKWLKNEGDTVELDEPILEIATDKVDSEVPAPVSGTVEKILFQENDVVAVGKVVAIISTDEQVATNSSAPKATNGSEDVPAAAKEIEAAIPQATQIKTVDSSPTTLDKPQSDRFYSPLVLSIARKEGIAMNELELVPGTGNESRVTKKDILSYIKNRTAAPVIVKASAPQTVQASAAKASHAPEISLQPGDEIVEMDRMRKLISEHMVMSKQTSPHVTSFVEADVTRVWNWRNKVKGKVEQQYGEKLTFTPIFIACIVKAIKDFPGVNISVSGTNIIKRKSINIGMAAALPSGNLIVPVIKNADELSLLGLTKKVNDLANRARSNKLSPDDIQGGTYTVTNVGTFGNVMGTPVINQPQVAIMATGAIQKKPAVIETPEGDVIAIRYRMFLSHAYDHRVVDGALGGQFVRRVADYLEQWDVNTDI